MIKFTAMKKLLPEIGSHGNIADHFIRFQKYTSKERGRISRCSVYYTTFRSSALLSLIPMNWMKSNGRI
jgi:hypothetical protein